LAQSLNFYMGPEKDKQHAESNNNDQTSTDRIEKHAQEKQRSQSSDDLQAGELNKRVKEEQADHKVSGRSRVTGAGKNSDGSGGVPSAESLFGSAKEQGQLRAQWQEQKFNDMLNADAQGKLLGAGGKFVSADPAEISERNGSYIDYTPKKNSSSSYSLGIDYEENAARHRTPEQKLEDFIKAGAKRASDPEGWKSYFQSELNKVAGIGSGLNEAKEETKAAAVAGWKALTDGTVARFLAKPNAINDPLFNTVANVLDAMSKDPFASNKEFEKLGTAILRSSEQYSSLPDFEKGKVIGKTMFAAVNPEGSTESAEAAFTIADKVATQVDKTTMDAINRTVKAIEQAKGELSPELIRQKELLYQLLKQNGLTGAEFEYVDIPKGFFNGVEKPAAKANENVLKMEIGEQKDISLKRPEDRTTVSKLENLAGRADFPERKQLIENLTQLKESNSKLPIDLDFATRPVELEHLKEYEKCANNLLSLDRTVPKDFPQKNVPILKRDLCQRMIGLSDAVKQEKPIAEIEKAAKKLRAGNESLEFVRENPILLKPGIHEINLSQVGEKFAYNEKRKMLFENIKQLAHDLKEAGCEKLYLDGSYITGKLEPGDFDACWEPFSKKGAVKHPSLLDETEFGVEARKDQYNGDIFPRYIDGYGDRVQHWQHDSRTGQVKGILVIDLRELK
jgi:hypothetical protein